MGGRKMGSITLQFRSFLHIIDSSRSQILSSAQILTGQHFKNWTNSEKVGYSLPSLPGLILIVVKLATSKAPAQLKLTSGSAGHPLGPRYPEKSVTTWPFM
jgi:hypothetical protein